MIKRSSLLFAAVITAVCVFPVFAQENATQEQAPAAAAAAPVVPPATAVPDLQWIWGEVVSVNAATQAMSVKYLDYDSDMEKTIDIVSDAGTKYEEVKGIDEIKPQDTVSIEYLVKDGKNLAKGITVERIEETDIGEGEPQTKAPEKVGTGPLPGPDQGGETTAVPDSSK